MSSSRPLIIAALLALTAIAGACGEAVLPQPGEAAAVRAEPKNSGLGGTSTQDTTVAKCTGQGGSAGGKC